MSARAAIETEETARLSGGPLRYVLRRSPVARRLRVTIHPDRGVVVTVPATARGRAAVITDTLVRDFLDEREPWIRRTCRRTGRRRSAR